MESLTKRVERLERVAEPKPEVNIVFRVINPDRSVSAFMVHDHLTGGLVPVEPTNPTRQS